MSDRPFHLPYTLTSLQEPNALQKVMGNFESIARYLDVKAGQLPPEVIESIELGEQAFEGTVLYRTKGAPTNAPVPSGIEVVTAPNGTMTTTLVWAEYTQGDIPADFLVLFYQWHASQAPGIPGLHWPCVVFSSNTSRAATHAFHGLNPSYRWSFGIAAARKTEAGLEIGPIQSPEMWQDITVGTPNYTGLVDGVQATVVSGVSSNFNARNDRIGVVPSAPTIAVDGTAIDHTLNKDGSANISFEWKYEGVGDAYNIDSFVVLVRSRTSDAPYVFGTEPHLEQGYIVPYTNRAIILYGVPVDHYFTFGVYARRDVDQDIHESGILISEIAQPLRTEENPYQPSARPVFQGDITGTIDGVPVGDIVQGAQDGSNAWEKFSGTNNTLPMTELEEKMVGLQHTLQLAQQAVTEAHIAIAAIAEKHISDEAITTDKIAANAITADKIAANAITADKIAANAITAVKIQAGSIAASHIQAGVVTSDKINVSELSALSTNLGHVIAGRVDAGIVVAGGLTISDLAALTGYGDGSDGEFDSESSVTFNVDVDEGPVVKQYISFKLNQGHTLTVNNPCKGLVILCQGDAEINGVISMDNKAGRYTRDEMSAPWDRIASVTYTLNHSGLANLVQRLIPAGGSGGNGGTGGWGAASTYHDGETHYSNPGVGGNGGSNCAYGGSGGGGGGGGGGAGAMCEAGVIGQPGQFVVHFATGGGGGGGGNGGDGGAGSTVEHSYNGWRSIYGVGAKAGEVGAGYGLGGSGANNGADGEASGGGLIVLLVKGSLRINDSGKITASATGQGGSGGKGESYSLGQLAVAAGGGGGGGGGSGGGVIYIRAGGNFINDGSILVQGGAPGLGGSGGVGSGHPVPKCYGESGQNGVPGQVGSIILEVVETPL